MMRFVWIVTLFVHLFSNTGYNTVLRHSVADRKVNSIFLSTIMATSVAIPAAVGIFVVKIDWSVFDAHVLLLYSASITLVVFFHICNAKALEYTEASIFSFLYNFRIGIATLLGIWLLSESVIPLKIIGGAFVFISGFILMGRSTTQPPGVMFSLLSAVAISLMNAIEKYLIPLIGFPAFMFPSTIIIAGLMWIIVIAGKYPVDKSFVKSGELKILMVFRAVSAYAFTYSFSLGALLSVATYISSLNCVTTPIAGIIFLREKDKLAKKAAAGLISLAGVTLILLAGSL